MKTNENSIWSANELGSRWRAALSSQSALAERSTIGSGKSLAIGRQHNVSRPRQSVLHPSVLRPSVLPVELKWGFTFFFLCLSKPRKNTRMLFLSARIAATCATTWLHCSAIEIFVTQSFLSSFALASSSLSNCRMRSGTSSLHSNSLLRTRPIAHNAACHWICCSFFPPCRITDTGAALFLGRVACAWQTFSKSRPAGGPRAPAGLTSKTNPLNTPITDIGADFVVLRFGAKPAIHRELTRVSPTPYSTPQRNSPRRSATAICLPLRRSSRSAGRRPAGYSCPSSSCANYP